MISRSEQFQIQDYLIASLYNANTHPGNHPYLSIYACNLLPKGSYLAVLRVNDHFDDVPEDDLKDYIEYLNESILCEITKGLKADRHNVADSAKFLKMVEDWEHKVTSIARHVVFASDPKLTDEALIIELKGLHGQNDTKYINSGDSEQHSRIKEIRENCVYPFTYFFKMGGCCTPGTRFCNIKRKVSFGSEHVLYS